MQSLRLSALLCAALLGLPVQAASQLQPLSEVFPVAWPELEQRNPYAGLYTTHPDYPLAVAVRQGFAVASLSSTSHGDTAVDGSLVDLSGQPGPQFLGEFVDNDSDAIGPAAAGAPGPLFVRRYQLNGTPLGGPVQVAAATDPSHLTASADGRGNAALSWQDGDQMHVLLVRRDAVAKGPAITISRAPFDADANGVALTDSGRLLVTWLSGDLILGQLWQARF